MKLQRNIIGGLVVVCAIAVTMFSCKQESGFSGSSNNAQAAAQKPAATAMPIATPAPTVLPVVPNTPAVPPPNLPPNAVTQGSFTVWANPANPAPGQNYDIFISVRLPTTVAAYTESDLSGSVIGTDGYQQAITPVSVFGSTSMQTFSYVPGSGVAQLVVHVPGAQTKVQDTVNVHSALLNESQNIAIRFQ